MKRTDILPRSPTTTPVIRICPDVVSASQPRANKHCVVLGQPPDQSTLGLAFLSSIEPDRGDVTVLHALGLHALTELDSEHQV